MELKRDDSMAAICSGAPAAFNARFLYRYTATNSREIASCIET